MFCKYCGGQVSDDARFCSACGKSLVETEESLRIIADSKESPVVEKIEHTVAKETTKEYSEAGESELATQETFEPKKKKGKIILPFVIAALIFAVGAVVCFFLFLKPYKYQPDYIYAYVDNDGNAYVCYNNGKNLKIGSGIEEAIMTPDRKKIVVVEENGRMYWTDSRLSQKYVIFEANDTKLEVESEVEELTNKFILIEYEEGNDKYCAGKIYRYEFASRKNVLLCEWSERNGTYFGYDSLGMNYTELSEDYHFAYAQDNEIRLLTADSNSAVKIADYANDADIEIVGVSNDGKTVAWVESNAQNSGKYKLKVWIDGKQKEVIEGKYVQKITEDNMDDKFDQYISETYDSSKYDTEDDYRDAILSEWIADVLKKYGYNVSEDQVNEYIIKMLEKYFGKYFRNESFSMSSGIDGTSIINGRKYSVYIKAGKIKIVKFGDDINTHSVYTSNGIIFERDKKSASAKGYYVDVKIDEDVYNLYYVDFKNGEKTKLLSNITSFRINENIIIYTDKNNSLKITFVDLEKVAIKDPVTIASDIYSYRMAQGNTEYLYYTKERSDGEDVYIYDIKEEESQKIDGNIESNFRISVDGNCIYYFKDITIEEDSYYVYGELYVYDARKGEAEKISSDVGIYSLTSNLMTDYIDPDSFFFDKYKENYEVTKDNKNAVIDVCYYNGKEVKVALKDFNE